MSGHKKKKKSSKKASVPPDVTLTCWQIYDEEEREGSFLFSVSQQTEVALLPQYLVTGYTSYKVNKRILNMFTSPWESRIPLDWKLQIMKKYIKKLAVQCLSQIVELFLWIF